jgi:SAM-dependent methyltransferase
MRPFRGAAWFYAEYRYRPSGEFLRLVATHLDWTPHGRVLDLGAGPAHLSVRLAPFAGEVVAVDPEEEMLAEGRRRAAGVDNISFVAGGSDDLADLELGAFDGVVISQALHWMRDQDAVLRALDAPAVAIVGYVKDPDYNTVWLDREPWSALEGILRRNVGEEAVGSSPLPHDPFPEILERSPFSQVELLTLEHEVVVEPSLEAALGLYYSFANVLERLGDRRAAFETEAREAVAGADTSPFAVRLVDSALIGRRPDRALGR